MSEKNEAEQRAPKLLARVVTLVVPPEKSLKEVSSAVYSLSPFASSIRDVTDDFPSVPEGIDATAKSVKECWAKCQLSIGRDETLRISRMGGAPLAPVKRIWMVVGEYGNAVTCFGSVTGDGLIIAHVCDVRSGESLRRSVQQVALAVQDSLEHKGLL